MDSRGTGTPAPADARSIAKVSSSEMARCMGGTVIWFGGGVNCAAGLKPQAAFMGVGSAVSIPSALSVELSDTWKKIQARRLVPPGEDRSALAGWA
jgi:hypothetical protein